MKQPIYYYVSSELRCLILGSAWLLSQLVITPHAVAAPPLVPVPVGVYSFDSASVQVTGPPNLSPAAILHRGPLLMGPPEVLEPGANFGLGQAGDALNGLSFANNTHGLATAFLILSSIDRNAVGVADPDPQLQMACVPYNAKEQASKCTAAGDGYASTQAFSLAGGQAGRSSVALTANTTLIANNYDEGGTSYKAMPTGSAGSGTPPPNGLPRASSVGACAPGLDDNVSSMAYQAGIAPPAPPVLRVYFVVVPGSPSLAGLSNPNPASGAHIFFNVDPGSTSTTIFATATALGLVNNDVVDGLLVFDFDSNGVFDGIDQVLFSLAPGSPSLTTIPGASVSGAAADVFRTRFGFAAETFANAAEMGLGAATDNIDALEMLPSADSLTTLINAGIRADTCPTLSSFGLLVLFLGMGIAGFIIIRRSRNASLSGG